MTMRVSAEGDGTFISRQLTRNNEIVVNVHGNEDASDTTREKLGDTIAIAVSCDLKSLDVTMNWESEIRHIRLHGDAEHVRTMVGDGYVGVYEGYLGYLGGEERADEPIIADVVFNEYDAFVALTIGELGEHKAPTVTFYGELTANLSEVSSEMANRVNEETDSQALLLREGTDTGYEINTVGQATETASNAVIHQVTKTIYTGTYNCGSVSLLHADSVTLGSVFPLYAVVNTNATGFLNYMRYGAGHNTIASMAMSASPDKIEIKIAGRNSGFYLVNSFPEESKTTFTLRIPVLKKPNEESSTEVEWLQFDITTSSTEVNTGYYDSSSYMYNTESWSFYQMYGWNDEFHGNYQDGKGLPVYGLFSYQGSIDTSISRVVSADACIRYRYVLQQGGESITLHMWTTNTVATSVMTITAN